MIRPQISSCFHPIVVFPVSNEVYFLIFGGGIFNAVLCACMTSVRGKGEEWRTRRASLISANCITVKICWRNIRGLTLAWVIEHFMLRNKAVSANDYCRAI